MWYCWVLGATKHQDFCAQLEKEVFVGLQTCHTHPAWVTRTGLSSWHNSDITGTIYQWDFQDPKMEVLYHIRAYFLGISPYIGLKNRPKIYGIGTCNESVPEIAIDFHGLSRRFSDQKIWRLPADVSWMFHSMFHSQDMVQEGCGHPFHHWNPSCQRLYWSLFHGLMTILWI